MKDEGWVLKSAFYNHLITMYAIVEFTIWSPSLHKLFGKVKNYFLFVNQQKNNFDQSTHQLSAEECHLLLFYAYCICFLTWECVLFSNWNYILIAEGRKTTRVKNFLRSDWKRLLSWCIDGARVLAKARYCGGILTRRRHTIMPPVCRRLLDMKIGF